MSGVKDDWARARAARRRVEQQVTPDQDDVRDVVTSRGHEATTARGHDGTASRGHEAPEPARPATAPRRPPRRRTGPRADTAVSLTVRVDPEEAPHIDALVLALRMETGVRLDKSEVIRMLLRLTELEGGPVRRALIRHIKTTHGQHRNTGVTRSVEGP